jgi:hypothetical protein
MGILTVGSYRINLDAKALDTESDRTNRTGHIETWENGDNTIFSIRGNLPDYVNKVLFNIAVNDRGYTYWFDGRKTW